MANHKFMHLVGILVLLFAGLSVGCGEGDISPDQRLARAEAALQKGEVRTAVIELKNALRAAPDNRGARLLLGEVYARNGDGASAEKEFRRALDLGASEADVQPWLAQSLLLQGKLDPLYDLEIPEALPAETRAQMLWVKSQALLARGDTDAAEALVQESLELQADSAAAMTVMARIQIQRKELQQAREWITKALAADEAYSGAWSLLGDLERSQGNMEAAEQAYTRAIEDPSIEDANRMSRALVRIKMQEYERAQEDIALLRKRIKKHPRIDYAEALLHYKKQEYAEAASLAEAALGLDPAFAPALFLAGASDLALGNAASADKRLTRYLSQDPDNQVARRMMAAAKLQLGHAAEAERIARPLVEDAPGDAATLNLLASALLAQGKGDEGIGYLKQVKAEQPESADASARLGAALLAEGQSAEGIAELEKAMEANPEVQEAARRVVMGHVRNGDLDRALEVAQENLERNPQSVSAQGMVGTVYLWRKETEAATKALEKVLAMEPGNPAASSALAAIAIQAGDLAKAKGYFLESLKLHPENTGLSVNLAKLAFREGDEDSGKGYLEDAIKKDPQALAPRLQLANFYLQKNDPQQCLSVLADVREATPPDARLLRLVAAAELTLGQFASAKGTLDKLQTLEPTDPGVRLALARAYEGLGNKAQTRTELEEALRLDPKLVPAIVALGRMAVQRNDVKEAAMRLQELKNALDSDHAEVLLLEGQVAELKGDVTKAVAAYRSLFDHAGTDVNLRRLSRVYWKAGQQEDAVKVLEQWLKENPNDVDARLLLAIDYGQQGRTAEAIREYQETLRQRPKESTALNNLAPLIFPTDPSQGLDYARRAVELAPDNPSIQDTYGWLLVKSERPEEGIKYLRRALEAFDHPSIRYHLAVAMVATGLAKEARRELAAAIQSAKSFDERDAARSLLGELQAKEIP